MRPRRLFDALGRPLNFAVRRRPIKRMGTNERGWDRKRSENLRASMTDAEIEALFERSRRDLDSLSIDQVGVLFLITQRPHSADGSAPET
jgi:hypothetical protein